MNVWLVRAALRTRGLSAGAFRTDEEQLPRLAKLTRRRRRRPPADRVLPVEVIDRLCRRPNVPLREKTLWRLAYETAGRAEELLGLNVEDLDLANKRARITGKGGAVEVLHFQSGSTRLLPRLIGRRRRGPLFLTSPANRPRPGRRRHLPPHRRRHAAPAAALRADPPRPGRDQPALRTTPRYLRITEDDVARLTAQHDPSRRRQ